MRPLQSGDIIDSRFEVEFCAGEGGMGRVYRCLDQATGTLVALKIMGVLGASHRERFAREARLLAQLRHPGIVRYLAHGDFPDGTPYLAMEWVDGEPLSSRVCGEPLSIHDALALARRLCDAMGEAHSHQIVHRDLKPANILLQEGRLDAPKVLDFGLARAIDTAHAITKTGAMVGTPAYMAPEQARKSSTLDARADVFALGCLIFESLTGFPAFRGPTVVSVLCKVLLDDPPWLRDVRTDVPTAVANLVMRMLAKDPEERPQDAREVLAALDAAAIQRASAAKSRPSIGETEQRFLSVVLTGCPPDGRDVSSIGGAPEVPGRRLSLHKAIESFDAELEDMVDGTAVVTLRSRGTATDRVTRAARCALTLRELLPDVPIVLATGRGTVHGQRPTGEVIDAVAKLLQHASRDPKDSGAVLIDPVTASLLDARFDQKPGEHAIELLSYRARSVEPRKLLGRHTPCVGRTRELATLRAVWEECLDERVARPVVVTGPAGIGKTRLVREWMSEIENDDEQPQVFGVRADPMGAGGAFGMLARLVRLVCEVHDGDSPDAMYAKIRARVEKRLEACDVQRVSEFLAEMLGAHAADGDALRTRAARHDPVLRGDQIRRAFSDWLIAETEAAPVVLLLEDMQWGDLPSVEMLDAVLRARPEQSLCIVAVARPEIEQRFPKIWAERNVTTFTLGPLRKRAAVRLVRAALDDISDERANAIAERSGGNPFFLEELIRAASEGRWAEAPDTVLAILQARLDELGPSMRRVLRAASVLGDTFSSRTLAVLLDEDAGIIPDRCGALVEREILIEEPSAGANDVRYGFVQGLWREASYASLTEDDRRTGHGLAAAWLAEHRPTETFAVAEHYELSQQPAQACLWYAKAAGQALEGGDHALSLARADKSERCGAQGAALGELRCIRAEAHKWRGENPQAGEHALGAMQLLAPGSRHWYVAAGEAAAALGKLGQTEPLAELGQTLSTTEAHPDEDAHAARVIALSRTAAQLVLAGRTQAADALLETLDETVDPAVVGWLREAQAIRAGSNQDPVGRVRLAQEAAERFSAAGDLRNACLQHTSVGFALNEIGSYREAKEALQRAIDVGNKMDLENALSTATAQLGRALSRLGDHERAEETLQQAIQALATQNNQRLEGVATSYLAWLLWTTQRPLPAEIKARRALELLQHAPALRASADAVLARVLLSSHRAHEALQHATSAAETLEALGSLPTGELPVRAIHAEALTACGDAAEARQALEIAHDQLQRRAKHIAEPAMRDAFLRVHEHARIVELFEAR